MTSHEEARIAEWHVECFEEQGFLGSSILLLLDWRIDPHDTANLINRGCSHELALQILRPLEDTLTVLQPSSLSV